MNPGFTTAPAITPYGRLAAPRAATNRNSEPEAGTAGEPASPRETAPGTAEPPISPGPAGLEELRRSQVPSALDSLRTALELDDAQAERLALLLRAHASPAPHRRPEAGGRIRYFGNACLALQTPEGAVVTDPFLSTDGNGTGRYTLDDLPDFIDLVLVTHGHHGRIVLETLLQLRGRIGAVVAPRSSRSAPGEPSTGLFLSRLGFPVVEAGEYDEFGFPGGRVVATPFPGTGGRSAYWVELAGRSAFIGTDAYGDDPEPCRRIRHRLGAADYAFLAMDPGGTPPARHYEALMAKLGLARPDTPRTPPGPSAEQAAAVTAELGAAETYVYAAGDEPWPGHTTAAPSHGDPYRAPRIQHFTRWCADRGITAGHLFHQHEWRW
ncbi:MBL fold metallo-hydrolase [Streptomyces tsukubensis]|uniref:MBL fold metallo-hydrolase n=1 Tax=Streptomyces tsukubensis TaxID=83656 RepID=UPI0036C57196